MEPPVLRHICQLTHRGDSPRRPLTQGRTHVRLRSAPTVNDLAKLLAEAMERPWLMGARRPGQILLRNDRTWRELLRHLKQLKFAVETRTELPLWDATAEDYVRQLRASRMGQEVPVLVLPPDLDETFPAVARWLKRQGRIELAGEGGAGSSPGSWTPRTGMSCSRIGSPRTCTRRWSPWSAGSAVPAREPGGVPARPDVLCPGVVNERLRRVR